IVLVRFDAQEDSAKNHRGDQEQDEGAAVAGLRRAHRERHRETAAEQDDGIRGAEANVQNMTAALKRGKIEPAINGVGGEKSAKKHNFSGQEKPDSEEI